MLRCKGPGILRSYSSFSPFTLTYKGLLHFFLGFLNRVPLRLSLYLIQHSVNKNIERKDYKNFSSVKTGTTIGFGMREYDFDLRSSWSGKYFSKKCRQFKSKQNKTKRRDKSKGKTIRKQKDTT